MNFEFCDTTEFLEACLRELLENPKQPEKIVLAYINEDGVNLSYKSCNYADLQEIGQECINEGTMRLIALNEDKLRRIREAEVEPDDTSDDT